VRGEELNVPHNREKGRQMGQGMVLGSQGGETLTKEMGL